MFKFLFSAFEANFEEAVARRDSRAYQSESGRNFLQMATEQAALKAAGRRTLSRRLSRSVVPSNQILPKGSSQKKANASADSSLDDSDVLPPTPPASKKKRQTKGDQVTPQKVPAVYLSPIQLSAGMNKRRSENITKLQRCPTLELEGM